MKLFKFLYTLGLTTVLTVSGVNILPFTATESLVNSSKAEAAVIIKNDYVWMDMPQTGNQNDNWSCGPTSAARIMNFYGHNVNRDSLVNAINKDFVIPPRIKKPWGGHVDIRTGTTPHALRDVMKRWEGDNVKLERKADFNKLLGLLRQGKPVVALLRVGSTKIARTTWPAMHWVTVNGFDALNQKIYFTETTDGEIREYSYDDFQSKWDWRVGKGLASEALHKNGAEPKTMIWVDRVPPVVAQSQLPPESDQQTLEEEANRPLLIPLALYWNGQIEDNATVATLAMRRSQEQSGYAGPNIQGCVLSREESGTVPLYLFWHQQRQDNATVATPEMIQSQRASGYGNPAIQGYIYPTQQSGTIPLYLFWHQQRQDNATVATPEMIESQKASGYGNPAIQGYIYPADRCR
jgi:hypothetical protein